MAVILDELKPLRLYRNTKYYYPVNLKNRMMGSIVYLMTPNVDSSVKIMNSDLAKLNRISFKSYFTEKNINLIINNKLTEASLNGEDYPHDEALDEAMLLTDNTDGDMIFNEEFLGINEGDTQIRSFFPDTADILLDEAVTKTKYGSYNFNNIFKRILYNQRMKTQKDCLNFYEEVKKKVPYLKFTFADYRLYKNRNLFYDWSFYTKNFMSNIPTGFRGDRGIDIFFAYMNRFLGDKRFADYTKRTIIIPILDWVKKSPMNYMEETNPITMFYRAMKNRPDMILDKWKGYTILFTGSEGYFTFDANQYKISDYAKLTSLLNKIYNSDYKDAEIVSVDSKNSIMIQLADRLAASGGIELKNLTGGTDTLSKEQLDDMGVLKDPTLSKDNEVKKAALVSKIQDIADKSTNVDDAQKELDNPESKEDSEWLKDVLLDLQSDEGVKMNAARIARMNQTRKDILGKEVEGKTVGELLQEFKRNDDIPEESVPIDSIDDSWQHLKFANFNKAYDMDPDITAMFMHFQNVTHPMNVLNIECHNTSTSEDYQNTWTCKYEDAETGKRHTMTLDIPRIIGDRFMKLRGNEKVLIGQLMLLPITKTDENVVQVVSNYNKIFVRRKSPSGFSKSTPIINKLCKALNKYTGKKIKVWPGDNRKICSRYVLPMEFIDIASLYNKIEFKDDKSFISFNMDTLNSIPWEKSMFQGNDKKLSDEDLNQKYLGVYVNKGGKKEPILGQSFDQYVLDKISEHDDTSDDSFVNLYRAASVAKRLMYSEASIMATKIPVVVLLSYSIGLQKLLNRMNVNYEFSETRPSKGQTYIRFKDGYLAFKDTTSSQNMMLNGLMECDFSEYSIKDINGKDLWLDMLDEFGGRIKADGFDNFYDLMFDPITKEICHTLNIPDNYIDGLIYANELLVDNKYIKHTDISGNRLRTNEVIVGHLYLVLAKAFGAYRNMVKRNKGTASFTAKRSAVIDSVLNHDQTSSDLSTLTPLLESEAATKVTFKGLSGMNSDRAFSMDKRTYDKSMVGVLSLSTGFASTVGINRQTTIDANIVSKRGFIKKQDPKKLGNTNTFTMMEAMSPMAVNHNDPIRTCMSFTQTVQHQMTVNKSMPNLISTGADEALPYLTSDKFAYKFKGKKGTVLDVTDDWIIVQDDDTKQCDYIDIREIIQKNSDGGFFVTTKLDANVKKGQKLKYNDIVAYNKRTYSNGIGNTDNPNCISYNIGTLAKVAIMESDLGYEDSCVVDSALSEALTSEIVYMKDVNFDPNTNVYNLVKKGDPVQEGDPLLVYQDAFDEKEANELLAALAKDRDTEMLSDIGRKPIHAKVTGTIQEIKVYRTCEMDQLTPSLKKICNDYDNRINKLKNTMGKYGINKEYTLESTGKLPKEGKLKNVDGVRIEIYIKVVDKFGIGDKLVFDQALKGVNSNIIRPGDEGYTDYRPNEKIDAFLSNSGAGARMIVSSFSTGIINKILIETARKCKDILGIKWKTIDELLRE